MRISDWSSDVCSSDLISERETAVMLLDCEKMAKIWQRPEAERGHKKIYFHDRVQSTPGMWRRLSGVWNARDHEYEPGVSQVLHYTTLQDRKSTRLNSSH